ncbi:hypothetical protein [Rhodococcus opacus]|uniref:Uncharacterized protein n=1 Tax=Rhodococcus opacus TaxID=37919 RepID=A0A2S8JAW7_RHOOP|nr:hypothetical protein [Rhodococcus opacus]PQP24147.1 hypothetical protein C5613_14805 [Rhodococcus opacus]
MSQVLINELTARIAGLDADAEYNRNLIIDLNGQAALAAQHVDEAEALASEYRDILDGLTA